MIRSPIGQRIAEILSSDSHNVFGSILLCGPWGAGKTHFWNSQVVPELRSKGIWPIYVSLFGLSGIDGLRIKLITSALAEGQWNFKQLPISAMKSIFDFANKFSKHKFGFGIGPVPFDFISLVPDRSVICFDDLERADMPIGQIFGFINLLCEHKKCRVLVISDETQILKDEQDAFSRFKEKIIGLSMRFDPDMNATYSSFTDEVAPELAEKLQDLSQGILKVFKNGGQNNARTLLRTLRYAKEAIEKSAGELPSSYVYFLTALIIEDAEVGLKEFKTYDPYRAAVKRSRTAGKGIELKTDSEDAELFSFNDRYWENEPKIQYSRAMYNFVKDGILNLKELGEELNPQRPSEPGAAMWKRAREQSFFESDSGMTKLLDEIQIFISSKTTATAYVTICLAAFVKDKSELVEYKIGPDFMTHVHRRLEDRAKVEDKSLNHDCANENLPTNLTKPLQEYFEQMVSKNRVEMAEDRVNKWFNESDHTFGFYEMGHNTEVLTVALSQKYLDRATSLVCSDPEAFFVYFRNLIRVLREGVPGWTQDKRQEQLNNLKSLLSNQAAHSSLDRMGKWRLKELLSLLG